MKYFAIELDPSKLSVEQIVMLGGGFNEAAPLHLEIQQNDDGEYLVFAAGSTPPEDWASVEEWGNVSNSDLTLTEADYKALPVISLA